MIRHAVILAAGRGQRLRPLTDRLPKPLVQVRGRALIDWRLQALADAGIEQVVINLAWLGEQIRTAVGNGDRWGLRIRYSDEGDSALETGGGLARARALLPADQPFVVCNADVWSDYSLRALVERPWADGQLAHLVLVPPPAGMRGDFALAGDRVVDRPRLTFSGISLIPPELVEPRGQTAFALAPRLREAMAQQRVTGECYHGVWSDIGTPERLAAANGEGARAEEPASGLGR